MSQPVYISHVSDTHLGYEAFPALSPSGYNQRGEDIVRAWRAVCSAIVAKDAPLVIHAGDALDRTVVPVRYMVSLSQGLAQLASLRPDGSRRQVVIVSGNHDQPTAHKEMCVLELFRSIPGVHVVTKQYGLIDFGALLEQPGSLVPKELADVVVHALPHNLLKHVDFATIVPVEGKTNVLTTHGVVGGSELYTRCHGREYAVPTDVLVRGWDYIALGHWHKRGPVPLVGIGGGKAADASRAWYAGSTENFGFDDLADGGEKRGWLQVEVRPGQLPNVMRHDVPIRTMVRLPKLDLQGKDAKEITEALVGAVSARPLDGMVVGQVVSGVRRDVWSLVDHQAVRQAASSALHFELAARFFTEEQQGSGETSAGVVGVGELLIERAGVLLTPAEAQPALELAASLLEEAAQASSVRGPDGSQGGPVLADNDGASTAVRTVGSDVGTTVGRTSAAVGKEG